MLNKPGKIARDMRDLRQRYFIDTPRPGLLEWLTPPLVALGQWLDVLLVEKRKWIELPWKHRFRAWRHGFSGFSYRLYELENKQPDEYLSDVASVRFGAKLNGRYTESVFSKVVFSRILKSLGAPQPPLLGIVFRGAFYPEEGSACEALTHIQTTGRAEPAMGPSRGGGGWAYYPNAYPLDTHQFHSGRCGNAGELVRPRMTGYPPRDQAPTPPKSSRVDQHPANIDLGLRINFPA
jgi:hypothetical protein